MKKGVALEVSGLDVFYGDYQALWDISLSVKEKGIVSVIGANGSGKSTSLNAICGLLTPAKGTIQFFGERIEGLPSHETVAKGITLVPEGRHIFSRLTVRENLIMGSYVPKARAKRTEALERVESLFPHLGERYNQMAESLSGGEQQMLAIARGMMSGPKLLMCDEVSLGLAPVVIKSIYDRLEQINKGGVSVLLVEQDVKRSLNTAQWVYLLLEGRVVMAGPPATLTEEQVRKAYFGLQRSRS